MTRVLDLDKVIDTYDTLKVNKKEYKVGSIKTETLLKIQKLMQEYKNKPDEEKGQAAVDQIYLILKQDNEDVSKKEIAEWGLQAQVKFLNWFSEPFLAEAQQRKEKQVEKVIVEK